MSDNDKKISDWLGVKPEVYWTVHHPTDDSIVIWGDQPECNDWLTRHRKDFPNSQFANYEVRRMERYEEYSEHDYLAIRILPELAKRGYKVDLQSDGPLQWSLVLQHPEVKRDICSLQDTLAKAICAATVKLIESI